MINASVPAGIAAQWDYFRNADLCNISDLDNFIDDNGCPSTQMICAATGDKDLYRGFTKDNRMFLVWCSGDTLPTPHNVIVYEDQHGNLVDETLNCTPMDNVRIESLLKIFDRQLKKQLAA